MNDQYRDRFEDSGVPGIMDDEAVRVAASLEAQADAAVVRFAGSAARSIDPRDRLSPNIYREDENSKKGE